MQNFRQWLGDGMFKRVMQETAGKGPWFDRGARLNHGCTKRMHRTEECTRGCRLEKEKGVSSM